MNDTLISKMNARLVVPPSLKFYPSESPNSPDADSRAAFYSHKSHIMIYTVAGKPVFTRYGDENEVATLCASLAAIIPNLQEVHNAQHKGIKNNCLRYIKTKNMFCVLLLKNNLIYTAISKKEKGYEVLRRRLVALSMQVGFGCL
eukprot:TRINITY_DN67_c1_g1_i1.p2 TRINITY_DN67_c1_g1~~TRINITY_DN67_c1_g1_i1.p2  ORF type:complete len:145 (+),score=23.34 TRINITY_DN67_c1_g1_i1:51-485(+)